MDECSQKSRTLSQNKKHFCYSQPPLGIRPCDSLAADQVQVKSRGGKKWNHFQSYLPAIISSWNFHIDKWEHPFPWAWLNISQGDSTFILHAKAIIFGAKIPHPHFFSESTQPSLLLLVLSIRSILFHCWLPTPSTYPAMFSWVVGVTSLRLWKFSLGFTQHCLPCPWLGCHSAPWFPGYTVLQAVPDWPMRFLNRKFHWKRYPWQRSGSQYTPSSLEKRLGCFTLWTALPLKVLPRVCSCVLGRDAWQHQVMGLFKIASWANNLGSLGADHPKMSGCIDSVLKASPFPLQIYHSARVNADLRGLFMAVRRSSLILNPSNRVGLTPDALRDDQSGEQDEVRSAFVEQANHLHPGPLSPPKGFALRSGQYSFITDSRRSDLLIKIITHYIFIPLFKDA